MKIEWIFYLLSCLSVIGALMVILSQNPIRSVLYLVFTFFTISAQYVLLNAQFLALVNVVVYAGAIMVLFLFVIMYLNLNTEFNIYRNWIAGLAALISGGCLFLIVVSALGQNLSPANNKNEYDIGLIEKLGMTLYRDYLLPMELSSVLFLVAMIGVVLLGRKEISETSQVRIP